MDNGQSAIPPPRTWLVLGDKGGDNGQVDTIAEALGWPCERKYVHMKPRYVKAKPHVRPSLHHIDLARSDPLQPPWPDLVITVGRRPSMVALWIKQQSGGRTRIVLVGKPSTRIERFDRVIASSENQLPPLDNVVNITLPLMRVKHASRGAVLSDRLAGLRRPLIGVLVGGPTGPLVYDDRALKALVASVRRVVETQGGTPYITTSRRTPESFVNALTRALPGDAELFRWTPQACDNPYSALLAQADAFIVTGDSISMMVEVIRGGKPLAILPLPSHRLDLLGRMRRGATCWLCRPDTASRVDGLRTASARALYRLRLLHQTRDFGDFHSRLVEHGLAVMVGHGFAPPSGQVPDDAALAAARVRRLMAGVHPVSIDLSASSCASRSG